MKFCITMGKAVICPQIIMTATLTYTLVLAAIYLGKKAIDQREQI